MLPTCSAPGYTCTAAVLGAPEEGDLLAVQEMSGKPQTHTRSLCRREARAHLQRPGLRIHRCGARALGAGLLLGCQPPLQLPQLQHLLLYSALHGIALSAAAPSTATMVLKLADAGSPARDRRS